MLHSELLSSFVSLGLAHFPNYLQASALEGLVRISLEKRDNEALVFPFVGIC